MNKTLYVPDHLAKKKQAQAVKFPLKQVYENVEKTASKIDTLSDTAIERLPTPCGWRILILPYKGTGKTKKGVHLPDEVQERESIATVCGYVLKIGPLAYKDPNKFGPMTVPWCMEGDWVIFGRYAGSRFKIEGGEVRLLNDDEILARIKNPDDILHQH
jgi:co-chaperonin GroES (HSP10)